MMGYELKRIRLGARLKLGALAGLLGVNKTTVVRWEAGISPIDTRTELALTYILLRLEAGDYEHLRWIPRKRRKPDPLKVKVRKWLMTHL